MTTFGDVGLLDAGDGRRLERFGGHVVDRPHPGAMDRRRDPGAWAAADLRFDRASGWTGPGGRVPAPWVVDVGLGTLRLELRPTESGGIGLFPEQLDNAAWLAAAVTRRIAENVPPVGTSVEDPSLEGPAPNGIAPPAILNLFAHTGLLTLVAAQAGAAITHVDGARGAVGWARRNAELSGLEAHSIRWIVDDALAFARREARRGRRYSGFVLDPPSYGHGGARPWQLDEDLPELLAACAGIADADPFVLLTAHAAGLDPEALADAVAAAFPEVAGAIEVGGLGLDAKSGAALELGTAVRGGA